MSDADNTIPIEAWNTILFEKFCRFLRRSRQESCHPAVMPSFETSRHGTPHTSIAICRFCETALALQLDPFLENLLK